MRTQGLRESRPKPIRGGAYLQDTASSGIDYSNLLVLACCNDLAAVVVEIYRPDLEERWDRRD